MYLERIIAKIGIVGVVALLLTASVLVNLWQFSRAGKSDARCATRISELQAVVARKEAEAEKYALEVGRENARRAAADAKRIQSDTVRYVERIREVPVYLPVACDGPMPSGLRNALGDAARAANGHVRTWEN